MRKPAELPWLLSTLSPPVQLDVARRGQVLDKLQLFRLAMLNHQQAYSSYLLLCQEGKWEEAARVQLTAVATFEAATDHYMSACRMNLIIKS